MSKVNVSLKNLTKDFKSHDPRISNVRAVDNITQEIKDGSLATLLGPSGCGKTTVLRMIAGFEFPTMGEIYIGETLVNNIPPNKRDSSMVFQSYGLFPHMTVYNNIAYGLVMRRWSDDKIKSKVKSILELVELIGLENRFPNQLSGGQQQRVALARALITEPKVLLFDEPLSNLDAKLRVQTRGEIRKLQKRLGITSIYVTHDQEEAMCISDEIMVMNKGKILQAGTPKEIYEQPRTKFVADFIGKANFFNGKVSGSENEKIICELYNVKVIVENRLGMKSGDEVLMIIRPEAIQVVDVGIGRLAGRIANTTYLGSEVIYEIEIFNRIYISRIINPRNQKIFESGEKVGIQFEDESIHIIEE